MCDLWFTDPQELRAHLKDVHSIEDEKSMEELAITDATATAALTITTQTIGATETVLLEDGIQVENITVNPIEVMEMEETATVVVEDGGVAEMCEEDVERLKQAGVRIQMVRVASSDMDEQQVAHPQVEVELEEEMVNMEETIQAVVVWKHELNNAWRMINTKFHFFGDHVLTPWTLTNGQCCWIYLKVGILLKQWVI